MACVALGSGGVKGNATAVVGTLYAGNDDRRDAGALNPMIRLLMAGVR